MNQTTDYKCYHVHTGHGESYIHIVFNYIQVNSYIATSLILRKNKAAGKHPK